MGRLSLSLGIWVAAPALGLLKAALTDDHRLDQSGNGCTSLADPGGYALDVVPVQALAVMIVAGAALQVGRMIRPDRARSRTTVAAWAIAATTGVGAVASAPRLDFLALIAVGIIAVPAFALSIAALAVAGWRHWQPARRRQIGLHIVVWFIGTVGMFLAIGGTGETPTC